jgi:hypothetical protein
MVMTQRTYRKDLKLERAAIRMLHGRAAVWTHLKSRIPVLRQREARRRVLVRRLARTYG